MDAAYKFATQMRVLFPAYTRMCTGSHCARLQQHQYFVTALKTEEIIDPISFLNISTQIEVSNYYYFLIES